MRQALSALIAAAILGVASPAAATMFCDANGCTPMPQPGQPTPAPASATVVEGETVLRLRAAPLRAPIGVVAASRPVFHDRGDYAVATSSARLKLR